MENLDQTANAADQAANAENLNQTVSTEGAGANDVNQDSHTQSLEEVQASKERILDESRKYKERMLKAEREAEAYKLKAAQEKENHKELADHFKEKYETTRSALMKSKLNSSVLSHAANVGCINNDALMKLGNTDLLDYDEATGDYHNVEAFVDDVKIKHPYLFQSSKATTVINASMPRGAETKHKQLTAKEIAALPQDEYVRYMQAMSKSGNAMIK